MAVAGVDAMLTRRPENATILAGDEAVLVCATSENRPVDWRHHPSSSSSSSMRWNQVYTADIFVWDRGRPAAVLRNVTTREYTLVIQNVTTDHSGTYSCVDRAGLGPDEASAELTVIGK